MISGPEWTVIRDGHASIIPEFRVCSGVVVNYFSRLIHCAHADVLGVLPVLFLSLNIVSWCHGGNTSAVSYFQDSDEAVCDMLEKCFSSTCCRLGMAGNLMSL